MRTVLDMEGGKGDYSTYAVILGHLAARIAKDEDGVKAFLGPRAETLDTSKWPHPAVRFLRGEIAEEEFLTLATDTNKKTEAQCFAGLDHLARGNPGKAASHFRWVKENGTKSFVEYGISVAELARVEASGITIPAEAAPHVVGKEEAKSAETSHTVAKPPEAEAEKPSPMKYEGLVLYVPTTIAGERLGTDPRPVADYVNALGKRLRAILSEADTGSARGLLVAVGIKTNNRSKVWCQAIEGELPPALLKTIERELGEVPAVDLKVGPAGFGLKFGLNGQTPSKWPEVPERWNDAAQSSRSKKIIPPDDVFKILWPDA